MTSLLSIILVGIITGNVVSGSMLGVDLAGNNLNSIKNALILSLLIFGISLISGVTMFVVNLALAGSGNGGFIVFVTLLVVAVMVQLAEYILEKFFPVAGVKLSRFLVVLIPTLSVVLLGILNAGIGFAELMSHIVFTNLGIALTLAVIAGVRQDKLAYSSYDIFKGNLMTLSILFVLAIVWTAF